MGPEGNGSPYRRAALGTADDLSPADGKEILTFGQAMEKALSWEPGHDADDEDRREPLTVRRAVERYLEWYKVHRRAYDRMRYNMRAHILPELGDLKVEDLTSDRIRKWHQKLAEKPARLRGGQLREVRTEEQKRARKVTANRLAPFARNSSAAGRARPPPDIQRVCAT